MPTLNLSLPDQLKSWVTQQVSDGSYSSASDYLRDLIREDIRSREDGIKWLEAHLNPQLEASDSEFEYISPDEIKSRALKKLKD